MDRTNRLERSQVVRHYFVDESGDGTLFNKGGKLLLGKGDVREHFILGMLEVADPERLSKEMKELRGTLVSDPYFKDIPSMKDSAGKTARYFHAKDDIPEIRKEVFSLLVKQDVKFFATVKSMLAVYNYVTLKNIEDPGYRYKPDELYELSVRMLFKNRLHLSENINVTFATRNSRNRSRSLATQLEIAKDRFLMEHPQSVQNNIKVIMKKSFDSASLQAVDYFLWALQRCYEKGEDRYLSFVWDRVGLVHDIDDTRKEKYGVYYTKKKPLYAACTLKWASD